MYKQNLPQGPAPLSKYKKPVSINNPSRSAARRVKNPLPEPTICPNCNGPVRLIDNCEIYGRSFGEWPYAYRCTTDSCDSYVGIHPFTRIPLGTLANKETREARKEAKLLFISNYNRKGLTRSSAYRDLSQLLSLHPNNCHFGWFDIETCERVIELFKGNSK